MKQSDFHHENKFHNYFSENSKVSRKTITIPGIVIVRSTVSVNITEVISIVVTRRTEPPITSGLFAEAHPNFQRTITNGKRQHKLEIFTKSKIKIS